MHTEPSLSPPTVIARSTRGDAWGSDVAGSTGVKGSEGAALQSLRMCTVILVSGTEDQYTEDVRSK